MNVLMPQLGETVAEGTVAAWYKKVGDTVAKDEIILDVETDKAATEVPAPEAGVITAINVEEGQTVDVGVVLAVINGPDEGEEDAAPTQTTKPDPAAAPPPVGGGRRGLLRGGAGRWSRASGSRRRSPSL